MTTMSTALLLIDIQNDYFPGGKMPLDGSLEASQQARAAISAFRQRGLPIVHIQHVSNRPGLACFLPQTSGVELHANVAPLAGERVIQKHYANSFRETPLLGHLRDLQVDQLVIAGMMTHMCVDATTRAAFDFGFACTVLHDACATRALTFENETVPARQVHASFLAALGWVYAKVVSTADYLSSM